MTNTTSPTPPTFYRHDDRLNVMPLEEALEMDLEEFVAHFGDDEVAHRKHAWCGYCYDEHELRHRDEEDIACEQQYYIRLIAEEEG